MIQRCRFLACNHDPDGTRDVEVFGHTCSVDLCQHHMNLVDMGVPVESYIGLQLPGAVAEKISHPGRRAW
jgi:hypothetical protein